MAIIQAIRDYIAACPLLKDGAILGVDRLDADAIGYTVDTTPCEPIVQKYTDGSDKRQFLFVFASHEKYGEKVLENIANSGFYDDFADWVERNNWQGIFPDLGDYRTPYLIEITSSGYAYDTGDDTARYQIQLRLLYYQDRRYYTNG
ncbi:chloramphenicol resistance protein [Ruminococcus sp.]|uniref:chloramphenicol resistance protein n=1 Tax=Ruminococcus sp. TaxID=41978 RepID=UPI0025F05F39|nr:chloramphenicol resistance protein [Ruminococcus sp.]